MKKFIAIALVLTMVLAVFSACTPADTPEVTSGDSENNTSTPAEPSADPVVTPNESANIVWAGWSGEEDASKDMFANTLIGSFNAQDNGANVSWIGWPWGDTAQQLLIRNQGNEQLDVAQIDISMFSTLAAAGVLADITTLTGQEYLDENFEAATLAVGQYNGQQLAIPWSVASLSMMYNPELLAQAGWENPPTTVAEFEQCLADVAALGDDIIPYGIATKEATMAGDFSPWLWTFGGNIYDESGNVTINNEAGLKTVEWYQSLLAKNYIRMDISRFDSRQLFSQGKMAFYDDAVVAKGVAVGNGVDPAEVNNVCRPMLRPVLNAGDQPQAIMWGHMLVVFDKSEFKEKDIEFINHLLSEEIALKYLEGNGMPPTKKSVIANPLVQNDPYISGFMETTKTGRLEEMALNPKNGEIKTIITDELQSVLIGEKDAQTALDAMAAAIGNVK